MQPLSLRVRAYAYSAVGVNDFGLMRCAGAVEQGWQAQQWFHAHRSLFAALQVQRIWQPPGTPCRAGGSGQAGAPSVSVMVVWALCVAYTWCCGEPCTNVPSVAVCMLRSVQSAMPLWECRHVGMNPMYITVFPIQLHGTLLQTNQSQSCVLTVPERGRWRGTGATRPWRRCSASWTAMRPRCLSRLLHLAPSSALRSRCLQLAEDGGAGHRAASSGFHRWAAKRGPLAPPAPCVFPGADTSARANISAWYRSVCE